MGSTVRFFRNFGASLGKKTHKYGEILNPCLTSLNKDYDDLYNPIDDRS